MQQHQIGQFVEGEGGHFGGVIGAMGMRIGVIWAPKLEGEISLPWHEDGPDVPAARSCFDSAANTLAMADAGSKLARWALDLRIAGKDDWLIPARDVLELAYRHLKPTEHETYCSYRFGDNPSSIPPGYPYTKDHKQTTVEPFKAGGPEAFEPALYWSSTQASAGAAWVQLFHDGTQSYGTTSFAGRARAVRLIQITG